jgi:hypothetical protein
MLLGERIGLAGLVLALFAIAAPYLWPTRKQIGAGALVGAVVVTAIWIGLELSDLGRGVVINPSRVSFNTPFQGETHTFTIGNAGNEDAYAVAFFFRIESPAVSTNDFIMEMPKSSQKPIDEDTNGFRIADTLGMASTDSHNRPVFTMSVYRLKGHETREITLTRRTPKAVSVRAAIVNYSDDAPLIKEKNRTMAPIDIGENLTCHAMLILVQ